MVDEERIKVWEGFCKLKQWRESGTFYIFDLISEHITLFQFIYTFVNVNHAVSIFGFWLHDSNDGKLLPFVK